MGKWVWWLWIWPASILHALDVTTTYAGLSTGKFQETNPLISSLIERWGLEVGLLATLAIKILIIVAGCALCWSAAELRKIFKEWGVILVPWALSVLLYASLGFHLAVMVFVAMNNLTVLALG
ncbi:MAG: DUF5658 family protein [bacterium]|nr:DUF5658 family protein [bacterium]